MTYAELSEVQARRSRQFAEAQTEAMSVYCDAERDLKDLQAENDHLREVVRMALGFIKVTLPTLVITTTKGRVISYETMASLACELEIEVE